LRSAVDLYLRDPLDYGVVLTLKAGEAPPLELVNERRGAGLGRDTWLGNRSEETRVRAA
jgi:predicted component of type VI protein secretion system